MRCMQHLLNKMKHLEEENPFEVISFLLQKLHDEALKNTSPKTIGSTDVEKNREAFLLEHEHSPAKEFALFLEEDEEFSVTYGVELWWEKSLKHSFDELFEDKVAHFLPNTLLIDLQEHTGRQLFPTILNLSAFTHDKSEAVYK